jgi:hypothetical protein
MERGWLVLALWLTACDRESRPQLIWPQERQTKRELGALGCFSLVQPWQEKAVEESQSESPKTRRFRSETIRLA